MQEKEKTTPRQKAEKTPQGIDSLQHAESKEGLPQESLQEPPQVRRPAILGDGVPRLGGSGACIIPPSIFDIART